MKIGRILKPIRLDSPLYSPLHFSPIFAVLFLSALVLVHLCSPIFSIRANLPQLAEWGFLSLYAVMFSFGSGLLPPVLVCVKKKRGYPSVYGLVILLSLIPILGLWVNPFIDISPISAFFQIAGGLSVALLFLWDFIKHIGTHDSVRDSRNEWIMHNAVAALLRRGEITRGEARTINPMGMDKHDLATRLECLNPFTRKAIERKMIVEELVQANKREFGLQR